jgi:hypothetical protein
VVAVRQYLLVLDTDLLALNEELDLGPINYLVAQQEQQPCDVVVLSLIATRQAKLSPLELLLGAATAQGHSAPAKYPGAPQPGHDISAAAEHRMNLAVRHLNAIGCQASGIISDQELLRAVRAETRAHDYDEVILATGRPGGARPAPGPGSPAAAAPGATAGHLRRRHGHKAEAVTSGAAATRQAPTSQHETHVGQARC